MNQVERKSWASAKQVADFYCIETCSGFRMTITDPQGKQHLLRIDASDEELGVAVLDALAHSRFVPPDEQPEEDASLFDFALSNQRYANWVQKLMVFKDMKHCGIENCREQITIHPTHHDRLEGWSGTGIDSDSYVVVSVSSGAVRVGAALRTAFARCT